MFMNGVDPESIWYDLLRRRITSLSTDGKLWESLEKHPSPKDAYLTEVAVVLLTRTRHYKYKFPPLYKEEVKSLWCSFRM